MAARRLAWWLWLALLAASPLRAAQLPDDAVKAAVIYKVMLFTHWPGDAGSAPLTLCVLGRDEVAAALPELQGRLVGTRPLQIRNVAGKTPFAGCSAAYIAASEQHRLQDLLADRSSAGLMSVVDCGAGLCKSAAVLSLAVEQGRLVFALNRRQADQQGLGFSAQVLRLAQRETEP